MVRARAAPARRPPSPTPGSRRQPTYFYRVLASHAACYFDNNQIRLHLTFSSAYSGTVHIYAVDWDALGRRETITVNDGSGPQIANIATDFSQGAWVNVLINVAAAGTVTVTRTAGMNAAVSGIFLG